MKTLLCIAALLLTSCATMVNYEGEWITTDRYKEIREYQHKVFDLGQYDQDLSMSVKEPE